jgi:hypothetical protein
MSTNWTLKNGNNTIDCSSFPFAFRTAYNLVRKATEEKQLPHMVAKQITILGPVNRHGDRTTYSYHEAKELATAQGLLAADGNLNSREFKRR